MHSKAEPKKQGLVTGFHITTTGDMRKHLRAYPQSVFGPFGPQHRGFVVIPALAHRMIVNPQLVGLELPRPFVVIGSERQLQALARRAAIHIRLGQDGAVPEDVEAVEMVFPTDRRPDVPEISPPPGGNFKIGLVD